MSLKERLINRIAAHGPISLGQYMGDCLFDPDDGYYATRDPFGTDGDFVTAPEISQMFGELIGLCLAQAWLDQGRPTLFALAELGPGRGTMMADILRAARIVPGFAEAADIHLVEASRALKRVQAERLADHSVTWHEGVAALPDGPLFLVANEFFDALPIRQFVRAGEQWHERHVGLKDGGLVMGLGPAQQQPALTHRLEDTKDGDVIEESPLSAPVIAEVGQRIADHGGAALIIDYGDWRSLGDTFQALKAHQPVDPLGEPGAADLTAHVDFEALAKAAPCKYTRLCPQGVFLERLGITARAQTLAQSLTGADLEAHIAAHRRLTHGDEMGTLFKVLGLFPESAAPPAGLEI